MKTRAHTVRTKSLTTRRFSMLEIVIALIIIVIGVIGIIGLFPLGMKQQQTATGKSFAGDAAEQFLRFNESKIAMDWNWIHVFANAKPTVAESWGEQPVAIFQSENVKIVADQTFDDIPINEANPYKGLFLLTQTTAAGNVEFSAVLRCWKTMAADGSSAELNLEISWPAAKPYEARDVATYNKNVFHAPTSTIETAEVRGCSVVRNHGGGYTTTLKSVAKKADNTYAVKLLVEHDGCTSAACTEVSTYAVEAAKGAYSSVAFASDSSPKALGIVDTGYDLGTTIPFDGFMVKNISKIGNGQAASFTVQYILTTTDGFPTQQVSVYNGTDNLIVTFIPKDFELVEDCTEVEVATVASLCGGTLSEDFKALFSNALYSLEDVDLTGIKTVKIDGNVRAESATAGVNNISGSFKLTGNIQGRTKITVNNVGSGEISGNCTSEGTLSVKNVTVLGTTAKGDIGKQSLPNVAAPSGVDDPSYAAPIEMKSGKFTISGNYALSGTLYVDGALHIESGTKFSGSGALMASGQIHFNNIKGAIEGDIFVCSTGDGIHFNNCTDVIINGTLYAAADQVHLNNTNGATVTGGVYCGKDIMFNNIDSLTVGAATSVAVPPAICASLSK